MRERYLRQVAYLLLLDDEDAGSLGRLIAIDTLLRLAFDEPFAIGGIDNA